MAKVIKLTDEGLKKLEAELESLKTEGRRDIAEKIKVARGYGDLSENSEYDEAKNEQAKIEARIAELEVMLKNVQIIEDGEITDKVSVGSLVKLHDEEFNEDVEYRVVGSAEADPLGGFISDESPIGKALLGKKAGDRVVVEAPAGELVYNIISITK